MGQAYLVVEYFPCVKGNIPNWENQPFISIFPDILQKFWEHISQNS